MITILTYLYLYKILILFHSYLMKKKALNLEAHSINFY
jgi:hypothetical protein